MSEDTGDPVNLTEFTTPPRGGATDPAKKVCPPLDSMTQGSMHHQGLCGKPQELRPTVEIKPIHASRNRVL